MRTKSIIITICILIIAHDVFGSSNKGLEVALQIDAADSGWGDEQVKSVMTLISPNGREVKRLLHTRSMEVEDEGDRSLVIFDLPSDVKGTVFLTHSHKKGDDDQWLYLPALKRVKRISSSNRSGPFMGSEFAYEDISSEEVERYTYGYIREGVCGNQLRCHIYERVPVDKSSGYSRQIVYADLEYHRIHKIEYYDRKGEHQKTLQRKKYTLYGKYWRADSWEMVNHQRKKTTLIDWEERLFGSGFTLREFSKDTMKRLR